MHRVFEGERTFLHPIFRPLERLIYGSAAVREGEEQSWVRYSASMISLSIFSFLFVYALQRLQGHLPLNPMHFSTPQAPSNATRDDAGPGVQYGRQFHDEYQLAGLFAGHDDELLDANGCSRRPELCFRRGGNCRCRCPNSRICAAHCENDREFLGGCHPLHALYLDAHLHTGHAVFRVARIDPKLQRARHRNNSGGADPGD